MATVREGLSCVGALMMLLGAIGVIIAFCAWLSGYPDNFEITTLWAKGVIIWSLFMAGIGYLLSRLDGDD